MKQLIEIIRKILLLINILVCLFFVPVTIWLGITEEKLEVLLFAPGFLVVGIVLHFVINWIFKSKDEVEEK